MLLLYLMSFSFSFSQEKINHQYFQTAYFYGNILKHNKNVGHFLVDHPKGFLLSWNKKSIGNIWESSYNYPDTGVSFSYQDYNNPILGELYSLYTHFNFYLLPRRNKNQLILRTALGIAYNTNPYDKVTNPKNVAFGSSLTTSTYLKLFYKREQIFDRVGVNTGLSFIHASNASSKSPNTGINIWAINVGVNYNLVDDSNLRFDPKEEIIYKEKLKYNIVFRFGRNESDIIDSGIKPFYVLTGYIDKRIGRKSVLQFGADYFVSYMLKDLIEIRHNLNSDYEKGDFKRAGVFIGYELFINKISFVTQLGYYVHYPVEVEGRIYERLTLKRYFKDKWFALVSLKVHAADAEEVAFGVGVRL